MRHQFYAAKPPRCYKCALFHRGPYAGGTQFAVCQSQLQMQALGVTTFASVLVQQS
eukprot:SAG31_NODE_29270_length_398_cov_0.682274_1_plen_55_part_01